MMRLVLILILVLVSACAQASLVFDAEFDEGAGTTVHDSALGSVGRARVFGRVRDQEPARLE